MRCWSVALAISLLMGGGVSAGEIGFVEEFALAPDRAVPLKQLVPGTEDYYYYHCLHFQNTQQYEKVTQFLTDWVARHGETARVWQIRTRQALLTYERNPKESLDYLQKRLQLHFQHQKEVAGAEPQLPVKLDPTLISRAAILRMAAGAPDSVEPFESSAWEWLITEEISPLRRRHLLQLLERPDYPNLVQLIVADLQFPNSPGFGAFNIHRQLTLAQLEALLAAKPDLLNQANFVNTWLSKLQPAPDEDWQHDLKLREAFLDRMIAFATRLAPVHNSLKAHLLYQRLLVDRQQGKYPKERFLEYLKLPRPVAYGAKEWLEREDNRRFAADLNADLRPVTQLPPIGVDEPLVRSFLAQYFVEAKDTKEFEPYVNDGYLKHLFAEVKIVNGLGDAEQWASMLPPELFQQLKERVDLDFAFENATSFAADQPVQLDVHVKNVSTLLVKVFEINTMSHYRRQMREIEADINLDGLVANEERTEKYGEPPLRRMTRRFEFPTLNRPGVYVIDFIGNGRSSRAVIRKGRLRQVVTTGPSGQEFTVFDERSQPVKDAVLWMAGREYRPNETGRIVVPFSTAPGRQPIVLSRGEFACLDHFDHQAENYSLAVGFYVDRESLLSRRKAQLVIRPSLYLNGTPVSLRSLEEVSLTISSQDLDGVSAVQVLSDFALSEDRETIHEFQVPQRLANIQFALRAKVKPLSTSQKVELSDSRSVGLNGIDRSEKIEDLYLAKFGADYVIDVFGKTGEPRASRPVQLSLKHRDLKQPVVVTLKTDPQGRIHLGPLTDIHSLSATGPEGTSESWVLAGDSHYYAQTVHAKSGEAIALPYMGKLAQPDRQELSLLELRGDTFVADRFGSLAIERGLLQIKGLPPGDYQLVFKGRSAPIRIRVVAGEKQGDFVLGAVRQLETRPLAPVQIESVVAEQRAIDGKQTDVVVIRVQNASRFARVHLFGTRFWPTQSAFEHLGRVRDAEPYYFLRYPMDSQYLTGRDIGDEYRYIIDRKYARLFPGNMLERPSLLLNPWAVRSTETGEQLARSGAAFAPKPMAPGASEGRDALSKMAAPQAVGEHWNLDFLAQGAAVMLNLVPDKDGLIVVPREALGGRHHLHVVAVDPLHTTYRSLALAETPTTRLDLRLLKHFDPAKQVMQQKQITIVPAGQPFVIQDVTTSRFELYDSVAKVYGLYATLSKDPTLSEFRFLLDWPKLKPEEKRTWYSKYASHELSFFLSRKDPAFFQEVIKPYLANKKDKTFVDRWLLERPLEEFSQPWRHGQMNVAERVLFGQRVEAERASMRRHVKDLYQLIPPNIDRFVFLFDTAVRGRSLETETGTLGDALGRANEMPAMELKADAAPAEPQAAAGVVAGAAPGAGGGRGPAGRAAGGFGGGGGGKGAEQERLAEKAKQMVPARDGRALRNREEAQQRGELQDAEADKKNAASDRADFYRKREADESRKLYEKLDKTQEWAENNYHHLTIDRQNQALINVNGFWRDAAEWEPGAPFLSRNLAEASSSFAEMLLAMGLTDLPFAAGKHEMTLDGVKLTIKPAGPMVVYHEEVRDAKQAAAGVPVLVSQNFFRHNDRYRQENNEQVDKFVTEEFLTHVVYGCQVVVTNPTSSRQKLTVLLQIPQGAVSVLNGQQTRAVQISLEPYHTQTLEYHFYFPLAGKFVHYPVQVAKNEERIAAAAPFQFNVVEKPTKVDTESWEYISQNGENQQVLQFLETHNVQQLNLDKIAFRMRDADFFVAATTLLAKRHLYQPTLWSYALMHNAVPQAREFLQHADGIVSECGGRLQSALLAVDPIVRRSFEHLEYKPLVNPRAHALGKRRQILNDRFHQQYHRFLEQLSFSRELSDEDWLAETYYLLLQDRVPEAIDAFAKVKPENLATKMQYDYFVAYLDMYTDDAKKARQIAAKYADHSVDRWRDAFRAILATLDEMEGKGPAVVNQEDRTQQQTQLAATEPSLDFQVEAKQLSIRYQNLTAVRVNYYLMDVELLFSHNPFVQQYTGQFSSIKPNQSVELQLPAKQNAMKAPMPEALHNKNVLIEITGGGQTKTQAFYSHSLAVQLVENFGQLKVTHAETGKLIPKAYVKVYAQLPNGQVRFYKDGYTDLRGRFDYASLNTNEIEQVQRFSILVLTEDAGALVREAAPPKR